MKYHYLPLLQDYNEIKIHIKMPNVSWDQDDCKGAPFTLKSKYYFWFQQPILTSTH